MALRSTSKGHFSGRHQSCDSLPASPAPPLLIESRSASAAEVITAAAAATMVMTYCGSPMWPHVALTRRCALLCSRCRGHTQQTLKPMRPVQ